MDALNLEVAQRALVETLYTAADRVDERRVVEREEPLVARPDLLDLVVQALTRGRVVGLFGLVREPGHLRVVVPGKEVPGARRVVGAKSDQFVRVGDVVGPQVVSEWDFADLLVVKQR